MAAASILCAEHGSSNAHLICAHLRSGRGLGYCLLAASADGPAQAWCEGCQRGLDRDGGWTEETEAVADFNLFCEYCFQRTLDHHRLIATMEW